MVDEAIAELEPSRDESGDVRRILVVDDDSGQSQALSYRLSQQGFRVDTAATVQEGRDLAQRARPDLVLLDVSLPDGNGLDLCRELNDGPTTSSLPVILLSGIDEPEMVRRARSSGCRFFLRKPYDPNALLVLVKNAIEDGEEW